MPDSVDKPAPLSTTTSPSAIRRASAASPGRSIGSRLGAPFPVRRLCHGRQPDVVDATSGCPGTAGALPRPARPRSVVRSRRCSPDRASSFAGARHCPAMLGGARDPPAASGVDRVRDGAPVTAAGQAHGADPSPRPSRTTSSAWLCRRSERCRTWDGCSSARRARPSFGSVRTATEPLASRVRGRRRAVRTAPRWCRWATRAECRRRNPSTG